MSETDNKGRNHCVKSLFDHVFSCGNFLTAQSELDLAIIEQEEPQDLGPFGYTFTHSGDVGVEEIMALSIDANADTKMCKVDEAKDTSNIDAEVEDGLPITETKEQGNLDSHINKSESCATEPETDDDESEKMHNQPPRIRLNGWSRLTTLFRRRRNCHTKRSRNSSSFNCCNRQAVLASIDLSAGESLFPRDKIEEIRDEILSIHSLNVSTISDDDSINDLMRITQYSSSDGFSFTENEINCKTETSTFARDQDRCSLVGEDAENMTEQIVPSTVHSFVEEDEENRTEQSITSKSWDETSCDKKEEPSFMIRKGASFFSGETSENSIDMMIRLIKENLKIGRDLMEDDEDDTIEQASSSYREDRPDLTSFVLNNDERSLSTMDSSTMLDEESKSGTMPTHSHCTFVYWRP